MKVTKMVVTQQFQGPQDVREILNFVGISWHTQEHLNRLNALVESNLYAINQVVGGFALVDTPAAPPEGIIGDWIENLLKNVVEVVLFPDPLPPDATTWESLETLWFQYIEYQKYLHITKVHDINLNKPWSIRSAVLAAWNIEFSEVSKPFVIGPESSDSAHHIACRAARTLFYSFEYYMQQTEDKPEQRPQLWESLLKKWDHETVTHECNLARASLATELRMVRQRLESKGPGQAASNPLPKSKTESKAEWLAKAMMFVKDNPDWSDAKIARKIGKNSGTLSRNKQYKIAALLARGSKSDRPKGYRTVDPDSGTTDVEAVAPSATPDADKSDRGNPISGSRLFKEYCAECEEPIRVTRDKVGKNPVCDNCE
ncbi:MAG: hypothetical protein HC898_08150 [Phycisphaerales bacterium]|nr:hypothetical protein [Phycisphaerales bacterium]